MNRQRGAPCPCLAFRLGVPGTVRVSAATGPWRVAVCGGRPRPPRWRGRFEGRQVGTPSSGASGPPPPAVVVVLWEGRSGPCVICLLCNSLLSVETNGLVRGRGLTPGAAASLEDRTAGVRGGALEQLRGAAPRALCPLPH